MKLPFLKKKHPEQPRKKVGTTGMDRRRCICRHRRYPDPYFYLWSVLYSQRFHGENTAGEQLPVCK